MVAISQGEFFALTWTLAGVASLLTFGRFYIRRTKLRGLHLDDAFHLAAFTLYIAFCMTSTITYPIIGRLEQIETGTGPILSTDPMYPTVQEFRHMQVATSALFWTCVFSVKFAFLFFYRLIFGRPGFPMKSWWAVFVFIALTFLACLFSIMVECGRSSEPYVLQTCVSPFTMQSDEDVLIYTAILNISSDLAVMAWPLPTLWGLHLPIRQKVSVTIIFGLASVIIAFDVVRAIMTSIASAHAIRPFLFETLELSIAVIISTLPSYRVLLPASRRTPNQSYESNMLANLSKRASPTSISPLSPANTSPLMVSDDNKRTETWNANDNRSWERQIHVHDLCPTPPEEARIVVKPREALGFNHDLEK